MCLGPYPGSEDGVGLQTSHRPPSAGCGTTTCDAPDAPTAISPALALPRLEYVSSQPLTAEGCTHRVGGRHVRQLCLRARPSQRRSDEKGQGSAFRTRISGSSAQNGTAQDTQRVRDAGEKTQRTDSQVTDRSRPAPPQVTHLQATHLPVLGVQVLLWVHRLVSTHWLQESPRVGCFNVGSRANARCARKVAFLVDAESWCTDQKEVCMDSGDN
jgi:hypothetical protein